MYRMYLKFAFALMVLCLLLISRKDVMTLQDNLAIALPRKTLSLLKVQTFNALKLPFFVYL